MRSRWLLWLTLFCLVVFFALGTWQLQRLFWKRALVERVNARVHAPPQALPPAASWLGTSSQDLEYRRLQLQGVFLHDKETLVQASTQLGLGFWVLTPLQQADGTQILVNRGFVPPEARTPSAHGSTAVAADPVEVIGLLRLSEPKGSLLQSNVAAQNQWFSRDVEAIAQARGLRQWAPWFVDQEAMTPRIDGQWPASGLTVIRFANNHLVYALTWYCLAALCGYALWLLYRSRWDASQDA